MNRYLEKHITVTVDRPIGSRHPNHPDMIYPVNYGYIPGDIAPDGEEQDVYILGVQKPIESFEGIVIAVIHRKNDIEDKLVTAPVGMSFTKNEITAAVEFTEKYFDSEVII